MQSSMLRHITEDFGNGGTIDGDLTISGDLTVSGGGSLSFDEIIEGTQVIDVTSTEALLVRKNGDGGDVFTVDTTNSNIEVTGYMNITNTAASTAFEVEQNTGAGTAVLIDQNTNAFALHIDAENTTSNAIVVECDALTSNGIARFYSNSSDTTSRNLFQIVNDHASATGATGLYIQQDSTGPALVAMGKVGIGTGSPSGKLTLSNGSASAPLTITAANSYIQLGSEDYGSGGLGKFMIGFGYTDVLTNTNSPAYIGFEETSVSGDTKGDLTFYTRSVTTDTAPTKRMSINESGVVTLQSNNGNASHTLLKIHNNDVTSNTETGQTAGIEFQFQGTTNGGSSFVTKNAGQIVAGKDSDYFTASADNMDSHLKFYTAQDNVNTLAMTIDSGQNIGIGMTPSSRLSIKANGDTSTVLDIHGRSSDDFAIISFKENASQTVKGQIKVDGSDSMIFRTGASTDALTIDSSQNATFGGAVGVGVTPETDWKSVVAGLQVGAGGSVFARSDSGETKIFLAENVKWTDAGFEYINNGSAAYHGLDAGIHTFAVAGSGSADAVASFTTTMLLDNNSRISLSNNDGGANNTVFGKLAGDDLASGSYFNVFIGEEAGHTNKLGDNNIAIGFDAMNLSYIDDTQDALTVNNIFIGGDSGGGDWATAASHSNIGIGNLSLGGNLNGATYNVAIGDSAMAGAAVTGDSNTGVGASTMYYNTSGHENVGVGRFSGFGNATGENNTYVGFSAGKGVANNNNTHNTGVGWQSLKSITDGGYNVSLGSRSGEDLTTGDFNVFVGDFAGHASVDGDKNVAIGHAAMSANVSSDGSVAVGYQALVSLTSGTHNIAIGEDAMATATTAAESVAIGYQALGDVNTGSGANIAIGYYAMREVDEGTGNGDADYNIAIGYDALKGGDFAGNDRQLRGNIAIGAFALDATADNAQTGTIAIGESALGALTSGTKSTAVGFEALKANTIGHENTAFGYNALMTNVDGDSNTAIGGESLKIYEPADGVGQNTALGFQSGDALVTGSANTLIGFRADTDDNAGVNQTVIGSTAQGQADNSVTLGNADVTAVYMAQDSGAVVHTAGIQFPASQVANGGANVLDDYEEGTWTPSLPSNTTAVSAVGTYTKVGNRIHITLQLSQLDYDGSGSGAFEISGLPFANGGGDDYFPTSWWKINIAYTGSLFFITGASATTLALYESRDNDNGVAVQESAIDTSSGSYIRTHFTYKV